MVRILVPPGMGDSYWSLVKLPAFIKRMGYSKPELTIVSYPADDGSHLRSIEYLKLFDFFSIGQPPTVPNDRAFQHIWDEAYTQLGRSIIPDVQGYDWFISYNGVLGKGVYLEDDDLECDWYPKIAHMDQIDNWADTYRKQFGEYAILFWPFYGSYAPYWQSFSIPNIATSLRQFLSDNALTPVFAGASWERAINPAHGMLTRSLNMQSAVDFIGQTSVIQLFGLLKGAKITIGYQSGLTMMAAMLKCKVLTLWSNGQFHDNMRWACVPPDTRHHTYEAIDTEGLTVNSFVESMNNLYHKPI